MYERNWLGGIRGSPRYTREKVRLSTRREREEAAEMTNRLGEGGRRETCDFDIAATLLDATILFTSKSKVFSPLLSPRTSEYRHAFGSSVATLVHREK